MNDNELFENYYSLITKYIEDNGGNIVGDIHEDSDFALSDNGRGDITISRWRYAFPQPSNSVLKAMSIPDAKQKSVERKQLSKISNHILPSLSSELRNRIENPSQGSLIYNTSTQRVECYYNDMWNSI